MDNGTELHTLISLIGDGGTLVVLVYLCLSGRISNGGVSKALERMEQKLEKLNHGQEKS